MALNPIVFTGKVVRSAYKLALKGESMRKRRRPLTDPDHRGSSSTARVATLRPVIGMTGLSTAGNAKPEASFPSPRLLRSFDSIG